MKSVPSIYPYFFFHNLIREFHFFPTIQGNVQQLLNDPNESDQKHQTNKSSNDSRSSSNGSSDPSTDDSSSEDSEEESDSDDVAMATREEEGLLGLKLSLPEDFESGSVERSILHRWAIHWAV